MNFQHSSGFSIIQGTHCPYPDVPYNGISKFESPEGFNKLRIESESNRGFHHLSIVGGTTTVVVDPNVCKVTTNFHIKVNSEEVRDKLWIEEVKDERNKLCGLTVRLDGFTGNAWIALDVAVRLPTKKALDSFTLSLPVSEVTLDNGLFFTKVSLSVAMGKIAFGKNQTFGNTHFSICNGDISGSLKRLNGELNASSANGNIDIVVKKVNTDDKRNLNLSSVNGHLKLVLPTTFDSSFKLASLMGSHTIKAKNHTFIHKQQKSSENSSGIYGTVNNLKGNVALSTIHGALALRYTK